MSLLIETPLRRATAASHAQPAGNVFCKTDEKAEERGSKLLATTNSSGLLKVMRPAGLRAERLGSCKPLLSCDRGFTPCGPCGRCSRDLQLMLNPHHQKGPDSQQQIKALSKTTPPCNLGNECELEVGGVDFGTYN